MKKTEKQIVHTNYRAKTAAEHWRKYEFFRYCNAMRTIMYDFHIYGHIKRTEFRM